MNHTTPSQRFARISRTLGILSLAVAPLISIAAWAADYANPPVNAAQKPSENASDKTTATPSDETAPKTNDKPSGKKEDPKAWKIAENWKLDIIAEHPAIHHPSVVFPAPDGRIFLAEDPMDMKGSSKEAADRILVIHPDGKITVFAEGLYAVFGMQYIDGKLYVHHTPKFSVFTDKDSVGTDRTDLLDCTNPAPNNNGGGFNDHIPSNCRLAMDGYLYISTGDKGIYGAESKTDHSKAEVHGGGVIRMRPDGTELETYVTGTRNHLDIAVNSEDELFSYDNTDDGLGWWSRFTHEVDSGYYGYPFDYRPPENDRENMPVWTAQRAVAQKAKDEWEKANKGKPEVEKAPKPPEAFATPYKPWTLWRMDETGGGSPTGSVAYNEEALPAEYHGNVFASEWGKGNVERFVVEREGGTYKVTKREIILSKGPSPLRPVGIQVLPDGTGILVADWNYSGWRNATTDAGRLLKLTYTGTLTPTPRPAWYVEASQGKNDYGIEMLPEFVNGLSHPAETVRLIAQRRIVDVVKKAGPTPSKLLTPVVALVSDTKAPAHARWHAIWTLDAIDGGKTGRDAIIAVVKNSADDISVRRQAARQLGTRKSIQALPALIIALNQPDESLRFRAATALGRIGDPSAVAPLIERLDDKDLFTHYAIFTALRKIGKANPAAWQPIVDALTSERTEVREGAALAMHETYDETMVKLLATLITTESKPADARAAAVAVIAPLKNQPPVWAPTSTDLKWWGTMPARNPAPAKDVEWPGTAIVTQAIKAALNDSNSTIVHAAVQGLKFAPDPSTTGQLAKLFEGDKDISTRKAILSALAAGKSPATVKFVSQIMGDVKQNDVLFSPALEAAETVGGAEMAAAIAKFVDADNNPEQIASALESLAKVPDVKSIPVLIKRLTDRHLSVINAAANALGGINDDKAVTAIAPLLKDKRGEVKRAAANALALIKRGSCLQPLLEVWRDPEVQKEAILALAARADIKALDAYVDGLGLADGNVRNKCRKAVEAIHEKALPLIEARLDTNPPPARAVLELQQIYEKFIPVDQRIGKLYAFDTKALAPDAFLAFAKSHAGDANNGKKVFANQNGAGCIKCHKVGTNGGDVGPSLDGVGGKYPRDFLVDSVLYPSKQILDGYQQVSIKRKNGNLEQGIVRSETAAEVTMVDSGGQKIVIKKSEIVSRKISELSLMPEGLQTALKPEEFADVIAYLESLKEGAKEPAKK